MCCRPAGCACSSGGDAISVAEPSSSRRKDRNRFSEGAATWKRLQVAWWRRRGNCCLCCDCSHSIHFRQMSRSGCCRVHGVVRTPVGDAVERLARGRPGGTCFAAESRGMLGAILAHDLRPCVKFGLFELRFVWSVLHSVKRLCCGSGSLGLGLGLGCGVWAGACRRMASRIIEY